MKINKYLQYEDINAHPDLIYQLVRAEDVFLAGDNNEGLTYGIEWLDDNNEVCEMEWFATEIERFNEVYSTNDRLRKSFYLTN